MLWGAAGIIIPLIIHFWHQKKGRSLNWAAMHWLSEKNQQQHRGFRLDHVLLLILRCLILILISIIAAKPFLDAFSSDTLPQKIHLVQPETVVTNNFRFELTQAQQKGESIYWISPSAEEVKDLKNVSVSQPFHPLLIQNTIQKLVKNPKQRVELYLVNASVLADLPTIALPDSFAIHTATDTIIHYPQAALFFGDHQVFVDHHQTLLSQAPASQTRPVHVGPISVQVQFTNPVAQKTVMAALGSLTDVYQINFDFSEKPTYDWILTDQNISSPQASSLYFISGPATLAHPRLHYLNETLTPQSSETVASGQLPEVLGEVLLKHYQLIPRVTPLNNNMLSSLFQPSPAFNFEGSKTLREWLLVGLLVLVGIERWMALKKNA